jgi:purine catabolism regulator
MPITIAELLELPHLALELQGGASGSDRPIRWAHVSEVEDPTPWLEGGELLLTTGIGIPKKPGDQVVYLKRLSAASAAGIVVVADSAPAITPAMVKAADDLGFPLITTFPKQPFEAITKVVFTANTTSEAERMVRHLRIYGVLRKIASRGASPNEILVALSRLTGMRLSIHRWDGRPQFEPGSAYPRWDEAMAAVKGNRTGGRGGLYARLPSKGTEPDAYIVQIDVAPPSEVFLIASGLTPSAVPDMVALHHIATIAATQVMTQRSERAIRQRLSNELLVDILEYGAVDGVVRSRLEALGLPAADLVGLAVAGADRNRLTDVLHDGLLDRDLPSLVGSHRHNLIVVVPAGRAERASVESLTELVASLVSRSGESQFSIGAGSVGGLGHVPISCSEAVVACSYAGYSGHKSVIFDRLDWPLAWLPTDPDRLKVLIDRTLGPILAYDVEHGSELRKSLDEFLTGDGRPNVAAKTLHIHRNTLSYRLRKIEQLTGLSLESVQGRAQFWLGLRAYDLTANLPARSARAGSRNATPIIESGGKHPTKQHQASAEDRSRPDGRKK